MVIKMVTIEVRCSKCGSIKVIKHGQPRIGQVDFGISLAEIIAKSSGVIEQENFFGQLKTFQSSPNNLRIESFSSSRSHAFEKHF